MKNTEKSASKMTRRKAAAKAVAYFHVVFKIRIKVTSNYILQFNRNNEKHFQVHALVVCHIGIVMLTTGAYFVSSAAVATDGTSDSNNVWKVAVSKNHNEDVVEILFGGSYYIFKRFGCSLFSYSIPYSVSQSARIQISLSVKLPALIIF
jgi:hypothetical protein